MAGRPSLYTQELGEDICLQLAKGKSLRKTCSADGYPDWDTCLKWALKTGHPFGIQYAHAMDVRADTLAEEIIEIADSATDRDSAECAKVRVDARKWVASKLKPKRYSEKSENFQTEEKINQTFPAISKAKALKIKAVIDEPDVQQTA